jgi:hypothetical protein
MRRLQQNSAEDILNIYDKGRAVSEQSVLDVRILTPIT